MKKSILLISTLLSINAVKASELDYDFDYNLDDNVEVGCNDLSDPFEKVNRKVFYFNSFLDYITLKPLAKAYGKYIPNKAQNKIGDFVDNIYEPLTTVNYGIQVDLPNILSSFWKFMINSTIGLAGTHNIADDLGLKHKPQTFGSSLAHYGAGPGPHIVLPILGNTNMRDMWDVIALDDKLNIVKYRASSRMKDTYTGIRMVHKRYQLMPFTEYVTKNSTDPYVAIRSALHQRRETMVHYPVGYRCGVKPAK